MNKVLGCRLWVVGYGLSELGIRINKKLTNNSLHLPPATYYLLPLICLLPTTSWAQCAMCRASLEGEQNIQKAEAVNNGIVYLMAFPYIIVAVIAIVIYRMYKKKK